MNVYEGMALFSFVWICARTLIELVKAMMGEDLK